MGASTKTSTLTRRQLIARMGWWALGIGIALLVPGWLLSWSVLLAWGELCVLLGAIWWLCSLFTSREPVRKAQRQYLRHMLPAMVGYVLAITVVSVSSRMDWPTWARTLVAVLPVLPMIWVVVSMWRMIQRSDELERRIHMDAIYVSCGITGVASFAVGMLELVDVWRPEGGLFWVLPAMFAVYGVAQWWGRRKYGFGDED